MTGEVLCGQGKVLKEMKPGETKQAKCERKGPWAEETLSTKVPEAREHLTSSVRWPSPLVNMRLLTFVPVDSPSAIFPVFLLCQGLFQLRELLLSPGRSTVISLRALCVPSRSQLLPGLSCGTTC